MRALGPAVGGSNRGHRAMFTTGLGLHSFIGLDVSLPLANIPLSSSGVVMKLNMTVHYNTPVCARSRIKYCAIRVNYQTLPEMLRQAFRSIGCNPPRWVAQQETNKRHESTYQVDRTGHLPG